MRDIIATSHEISFQWVCSYQDDSGTSDELLAAAGYLADRISVNLELPTEEGLRTLAPNKTMPNILNPMGKVQSTIASHRMAIGKSAYMERSGGNKFLDTGIFSDTFEKAVF